MEWWDPPKQHAEIKQEVVQHKDLWWGYLHTSGTLQAKRYFGPLDIQEANHSPFCVKVVGPFEASDRDEALIIIRKETGHK